jgi:hypothetical protein
VKSISSTGYWFSIVSVIVAVYMVNRNILSRRFMLPYVSKDTHGRVYKLCYRHYCAATPRHTGAGWRRRRGIKKAPAYLAGAGNCVCKIAEKNTNLTHPPKLDLFHVLAIILLCLQL